MMTAEQIVASHKANVETLFGLTQKAFEGVEKLVDLNLQATKAAFSESASSAQALLSVKDVQGLVALSNGDLKAAADKANAYGRELYEIAQGVGAEFAKAAEARAAEAQKQLTSLVDSAVKSAPSFQNASTAFESVQKAFKQATEQAAANFNSLASSALNAAETVKAKKAA